MGIATISKTINFPYYRFRFRVNSKSVANVSQISKFSQTSIRKRQSNPMTVLSLSMIVMHPVGAFASRRSQLFALRSGS